MVIMQRRWTWLGHVIRKDRDSITRTALRWTSDSGRRRRRRPRETWRRTIEAKMRTAGKTWKELEKAAMDREQWKSLISALCATYNHGQKSWDKFTFVALFFTLHLFNPSPPPTMLDTCTRYFSRISTLYWGEGGKQRILKRITMLF